MAHQEPNILELIIRPDVTIRVHGIPWDFTPEEAERVAGVIRGYAALPAPIEEVR